MTNGRKRGHAASATITSVVIPCFIYFFSIGIYLHPLTSAPTPSNPPDDANGRWSLIYSPRPQLDEMHIMSSTNHDIVAPPTSSWKDAWHNDYWGRPVTADSSHKSWRPLSIWSFRLGKGGVIGRLLVAIAGRMFGGLVEGILGLFGCGFRSGDEPRTGAFEGMNFLASELFVHRFVNVMIHAALVQLVGTLAARLFYDGRSSSPNNNLLLCTKWISQFLFAIHPVHVEAVVNVANRPHILALLFNATIADPDVPLVAVAILATLGLLTAETAIFQFPAIVMTMTAIRYRELIQKNAEKRSGDRSSKSSRGEEKKSQKISPFIGTFTALLPRYVLLVIISLTYLLYRHYNDTLSIPVELMRPAENPFFDMVKKNKWSSVTRAINYSFILSLHILKSFGVELIGYSHEYGFDCIPSIQSKRDWRLTIPVALLLFFEGLAFWSWFEWRIIYQGDKRGPKRRRREREERVLRILLVLVFYSWIATLFPIAGIIKVGTFVADRIAVAASFGSCIFAGRLLALWMSWGDGKGAEEEEAEGVLARPGTIILPLKIASIFWLCANPLAGRTHGRAAAWMDSVPLLESSLRACPRSIKSNLELSKIYSGLVPHMLDLEKSLSLISKAQSIDPTFCDVHQQYGHVYFQQSKYLLFEEEIAKSLLCPFTMGMAMNNWNRYWKLVLRGGQDRKSKERYEKYMKNIEAEIAKQEKEERRRKNSERGAGVEEEL